MALTVEIIIFLALIGSFAGLMAGLLGVGGGLITVPSLLFTFHLLGFSSPYLMHVALGTSLGAMVFTAASSALGHYRQKGINWLVFRTFAPGIILGAILGAIIADDLPSRKLKIISGIAECLIGLYFLIPQKDKEIIEPHPRLRSFAIMTPIAMGIGTLSSILGVGGGIVTVPVLVAFGLKLRNAISTSAAVGFLIAVIGAISYLALGIGKETLPHSVGYLYLPGFIVIGLSSSLMASYGAKLAYILPLAALRIIFALMLIVIGIAMIF